MSDWCGAFLIAVGLVAVGVGIGSGIEHGLTAIGKGLSDIAEALIDDFEEGEGP